MEEKTDLVIAYRLDDLAKTIKERFDKYRLVKLKQDNDNWLAEFEIRDRTSENKYSANNPYGKDNL
jgi:hypothetical protein